MSLINSTYFEKRLLALPGLSDTWTREQLIDYISEFEDKYLDEMLGVKLKNQFLTGLEAATPDQIWIDLRDGKEYDISGITYRWQGFLNDKKLSPIANYIFCNMTTDNQFMNTGIGEARSTAENATIITPQYRISVVWSEMAKLNCDLANFLTEFESDYPDWNFSYNTSLMKLDNVLGF